MVNVVVAPDNERTRVRIQNYSDVNPVALRRVLTDPNLPSNATLNQTFATLLLAFDPESQLFTLPENIVSPVKASNEPGKSRIWNDFTFPEIGHGDEFLNMESIVEKDPDDPQAMASGIAPPHPYLSVEKATRVNQWVVERAEMEADDEPEPEQESEPDISREPAPTTKKTPGIRTRKAAADAYAKAPEPAAQLPEPKSGAVKPSHVPEKTTPGPRKVWKMQYDAGVDKVQTKPLDPASDSPQGSSTKARPQTPEEKLRFPVTFDPTKYGLNRSPQHTAKDSFSSTASPRESLGEGENLPSTPQRKLKSRDLVDVFAPVATEKTVSHPLMSFNQPALVPRKFGDNSTAGLAQVVSPTDSHGLLGLECEKGYTSGDSNATDQGVIPADTNDASWQDKKLYALKQGLKHPSTSASASGDASAFASRPVDRCEVSKRLARQTLAQVEKNIETMKANDETKTREFHRTMNQKAGKPGIKPGSKAISKAEAKAKRQATLEDAWCITKPVSKPAAPSSKPEDTVSCAKDELILASKDKKPNPEQIDPTPAENEAQQQSVTAVFEALQPALEAAEYFPGPLTFEIQLGLVLIPLLPKTYNNNSLISVSEWTRIFQPRNGIPPPTTNFINRLTTTGSDVDHIIDLKTSKAEDGKKHHLFEQDYTEYNVSYEFHCCTTANQPFMIAIDEQGKHAIRKPAATLGAVNLHFPRHIWDASVTLGGIIEHIPGSDPELEESVQYLVDNLWIQPDRSLVRIFSRLPKDNNYVIQKVLMKRYTRHRHIRPGDHRNTGHAAPIEPQDHDHDHDQDQEQDIFLQVLEVQDLLIGSSTSDAQALRARCAAYPEMIKNNRLWYEVSVVSPAIETFLKANANVEIGDRTEDWSSPDLLGKDITLLNGDHDDEDEDVGKDGNSPVAMAIGSAGLGDLLQLTCTIVEKIDGIGFWNYGPGVEAVRLATIAGGGSGGGVTGPLTILPGPDKQPGLESALVVRTEQARLGDLDEKEVESTVTKVPFADGAAIPVVAPVAPAGGAVVEQSLVKQQELEYW